MTIVIDASVSPVVTPEQCAAPSRPTSHHVPPKAFAGLTGRASGPAPKRRELSFPVAALAYVYQHVVEAHAGRIP